jgi:hypothetical protein
MFFFSPARPGRAAAMPGVERLASASHSVFASSSVQDLLDPAPNTY